MLSAESAASAKGHVLLVDDEPGIVRSYGRLLRTAGFRVTELTDPCGVADVIATDEVDVIVTDVGLPVIDGIQILQIVRAAHPTLPVVLITGAGDLPSAIKAVEHGAHRYLQKPVDSHVLVAVVEDALAAHRRAEEHHRAVAYYERLGQQASFRSSIAGRFDRALEGLYMAYQPIVRWSDRSVYAYEALVRSTERGLSRPQALFSAGESLDRLHDLGRATRRLVAATMEQAPPDLQMFVNLHPHDLDDESLMSGECPLTRMASRVVLEVTERTSLDLTSELGQRLVTLRNLGYRLAIDDLGAGYSGLTALTQIRPEVVKVDMSLVRGIDDDPTKRKLVAMLAASCRDLGMLMIAEGVETTDERDVLVRIGCDLLQGHLFATAGAAFPSVDWGSARPTASAIQ